jgi:hypothetical protein
MDVDPEAMGERASMRFSAWATLRQQAGPWWEFLFAAAKAGLPPGRRLAGYALAVATAPLLALVLARLRGQGHAGTIGGAGNAAVLGVFIAVAVAVSLLAATAARHAGQGARAAADCELLASAAASIAAGQEALAAVLDRAREASGMQSATLLERGPSANDATWLAAGWTPVAVSGGPPAARPDQAAVAFPANGSLCLALGGRPLGGQPRRARPPQRPTGRGRRCSRRSATTCARRWPRRRRRSAACARLTFS